MEVLKQGQYRPLPVERQVVILYAASRGRLDGLAVDVVQRYERELESFMSNQHPEIYQAILEKRELTDDLRKQLDEALEEFKARFSA